MTIDAATREAAVSMVRDDHKSFREVAQAFGVSHQAVLRWCRMAEQADADARAAAPPPVESEPDISGEGTLADLKRMMSGFMRDSRAAAAAGNARGAASLAGHASRLAPVIAGLEKAAGADPTALRVTTEELKAAEARVLEEIRLAKARPLMCAECSRALSLEMAGLTEDSGVTPGRNV